MQTASLALRFFYVVNAPHPLVRAGLLATVAVTLAVVLISADRTGAVVTPLFLLQAMGSSSGFSGPARRGYYDLVLTMGCGRMQAGLAHWAVSVWPGLTAWMAAIAVEKAFGATSALTTPGVVAGMMLASTVPWALTVSLPRLTGGLAIVIVLASAAAVAPPAVRETALEHAQAAGPVSVGIVALVSLGVTYLALRAISRVDFPLEAGQ